MTFFWFKDSKSLKIAHFGAVGGQEWRLGGQKVGVTLRLIWRVRFNLGKTLALTFCILTEVSKSGAHLSAEH
eukprot:1138063-Pelagomonas_calceolata.AAC.6